MIHFQKRVESIVDNSAMSLTASEVIKYVKLCIKTGALTGEPEVFFGEIKNHESMCGLKRDSSGKLETIFIFPKDKVEARILKHEIGHGMEFTEMVKNGRKHDRYFFRGSWMRRKTGQALGFEYRREKRAWIHSGISNKDPLVLAALTGYALKATDSLFMFIVIASSVAMLRGIF